MCLAYKQPQLDSGHNQMSLRALSSYLNELEHIFCIQETQVESTVPHAPTPKYLQE